MVSQESNCLLDKLPYITYLLDSENKDIVWSLFDQYKIKQKIQTAEDNDKGLDAKINQLTAQIQQQRLVSENLKNKYSSIAR